MNKCVLYIPRPGWNYKMIQHGYVDALRYAGWKVYIGNPKSKLGCAKIIEDYNIKLIITHSRYGIRQLPVDIINKNNVTVFIEILPLNDSNLTIDGPYEFAHQDEPYLIDNIESFVAHTRLEPNLWNDYMSIWIRNNINILHLPAAGNIIKALPPTCSILTDVAMVANFRHRQNIMKQLIEPLFKRIDLLGYSYQVFGDDIWARAGLNYNGPLPNNVERLAHIYATARVCPNVHTDKQINLKSYINERSFMITLCGGVQVSDNPLASKYLGQYCVVSNTITTFMNNVIELIEDQSQKSDIIRSGVEYVANNHTYFNRLINLFETIGLDDKANEINNKAKRMAVRHCWEIDARLSAKERGISYEQETVAAA